MYFPHFFTLSENQIKIDRSDIVWSDVWLQDFSAILLRQAEVRSGLRELREE